MSPTPPGGFVSLHFRGMGCHLGNGIWRGYYTQNVSGCAIISGIYEFRMFDDHQGTLATRDDMHTIGSNVGVVDLQRR